MGKHVADSLYPRHAREQDSLAVGAGVTAVIILALSVLAIGVALSQGIVQVSA